MNIKGLFFKPEELESVKLSSASQLQQLNGMIIQQLVQWLKFYKLKSISMSLSVVGVTTSPDITFVDLTSKSMPIPEGIRTSKVFVLRNIISNLMLMGGVRSISVESDSNSTEEVNLIWEKMIKGQLVENNTTISMEDLNASTPDTSTT
jgi:hypothetical protein